MLSGKWRPFCLSLNVLKWDAIESSHVEMKHATTVAITGTTTLVPYL